MQRLLYRGTLPQADMEYAGLSVLGMTVPFIAPPPPLGEGVAVFAGCRAVIWKLGPKFEGPDQQGYVALEPPLEIIALAASSFWRASDGSLMSVWGIVGQIMSCVTPASPRISRDFRRDQK